MLPVPLHYHSMCCVVRFVNLRLANMFLRSALLHMAVICFAGKFLDLPFALPSFVLSMDALPIHFSCHSLRCRRSFCPSMPCHFLPFYPSPRCRRSFCDSTPCQCYFSSLLRVVVLRFCHSMPFQCFCSVYIRVCHPSFSHSRPCQCLSSALFRVVVLRFLTLGPANAFVLSFSVL